MSNKKKNKNHKKIEYKFLTFIFLIIVHNKKTKRLQKIL